MKLFQREAKEEAGHKALLEAFASYILSRLAVAAFAEDPAHDHLEPLATLMGVPLEIRTAKTRVHEVFPPRLANGIERLLTGEPWTESEAGSGSRGAA